MPHLSYIGDADIGAGTNIGAGAITANYDGRRKHRTIIGAHVHTGSDNVFVAPVTIGDDAIIGAGSIITEDVPASALGIARARQVNIEDYAVARPTMADTSSSQLTTFVAPPPAPDLEMGRVVEHDGSRTEAADALRRPLQPRPGQPHRAAAAGRARLERHAEDVRQRRAVRPLRRVRPRRRRVPRAVVRSRGRRPVGERLPHGAADHGRRRAAGLGQARHRRRAAGTPTRGRTRSRRRASRSRRASWLDAAARRRRRPRADDGPARRPGAGLLRRAGRPHDRAADVRAVLPRPGIAARRGRASCPPTPGRAKLAKKFAEMLDTSLAIISKDRPDAQRRRGDRGDRRREGARLRRDHLRRHDRHRRHPLRGRRGRQAGRRGAGHRLRDAPASSRRRRWIASRTARSTRSSCPTPCRSIRSRAAEGDACCRPTASSPRRSTTSSAKAPSRRSSAARTSSSRQRPARPGR